MTALDAATTDATARPPNDRLPGVRVPPSSAQGGGFVSPRDATERWLAAMWADALGYRAVGVTDDFAALSGDDEAAAQITTRVADHLGAGAEFDLSVVFALRTVEAMADLVRDCLDPARVDPITVLRPPDPAGVRQRPVFLFAPADGSTGLYAPLVDRLGADIPVYGLEPLERLIHGASRAARYRQAIRELLSAWPNPGPYRLGGFGSGGIVALEVAKQLVAAGEPVDLVFVVDPAPDGTPSGPGRHRDRVPAAPASYSSAFRTWRRTSDGYDDRVVLYTSPYCSDARVADWTARCADLEVVALAGPATAPGGSPKITSVAAHLSDVLARPSGPRSVGRAAELGLDVDRGSSTRRVASEGARGRARRRGRSVVFR